MSSVVRKHIVVVPGFGGFDALGNMSYYAGLAALLQTWKGQRNPTCTPTIHYFENHPTASVSFRANLLLEYLSQKLAFGAINADEEVTLLGHSTGGLDIRQLLFVLRGDPAAPLPLRREGVDLGLAYKDVRRVIRRVVYMSVPHFGTNIADFMLINQIAVQDLAGDVANLMKTTTRIAPLLGIATAGALPIFTSPCDLIKAVEDVCLETDGVAVAGANAANVARNSAYERETRNDIVTWLSEVNQDASALEDLCIYRQNWAGPVQSPAHHTAQQRADELADYQGQSHPGDPPITTLSLATHGPDRAPPPPIQRRIDQLSHGLNAGILGGASIVDRLWSTAAAVYNHIPAALRPWAPGPAISSVFPGVALALQANPGLLYDVAHYVTARMHGPNPANAFIADNFGATTLWGPELAKRGFDAATNDGIVNTLSMLWPAFGPNDQTHAVEFVSGDHGDIIGHYALAIPPAPLLTGRRYTAYDLLQCGAGFDHAEAERIWFRVFNFAF